MEVAEAKAGRDPAAARTYSPEEWEVRVALAACYRLAVHFDMTDILNTHITARVPGADEHFLINPYGLLFHEVTASNLIKIDLDGNVMQETEYPVNRAGYVIHSAVHRARKDIHCVVHNHTLAGVAVSARKEGLLPISQTSLQFYNRVSYHGYEGPLCLDDGVERVGRGRRAADRNPLGRLETVRERESPRGVLCP